MGFYFGKETNFKGLAALRPDSKFRVFGIQIFGVFFGVFVDVGKDRVWYKSEAFEAHLATTEWDGRETLLTFRIDESLVVAADRWTLVRHVPIPPNQFKDQAGHFGCDHHRGRRR